MYFEQHEAPDGKKFYQLHDGYKIHIKYISTRLKAIEICEALWKVKPKSKQKRAM